MSGFDAWLSGRMACSTSVPCCHLGDHEIHRAPGAVGHASDGELVATRHRLLFEPWNLGLVDWLVQYGCRISGESDAEPDFYVVGKRADCADPADGVGDIVGARPIAAASWTSSPALGIEKSDGTEAVFGVGCADTDTSPSDRAARDHLLAVISETFLRTP
jgi:hypothetical protein